jgi:hypothetical protein
MAREAGAYAVLVLSGSTSSADLLAVSPELQPHLVLPDINALLEQVTPQAMR